MSRYHISVRRACEIFSLSRSSYYYIKKSSDDSELMVKILNLANLHPKFGYWKIYYLLRDEGKIINHKRVYRIYKNLKLTLKHGMRNCDMTIG